MRKKVIALVLTSALLMAAAGMRKYRNAGAAVGRQKTHSRRWKIQRWLLMMLRKIHKMKNRRTGDVIGAAEGTAAVPEETEDGSRILVAYFSWADNAVTDENVDAVSSPSVTAPGNVQELAGWVQEETGGRPCFLSG